MERGNATPCKTPQHRIVFEFEYTLANSKPFANGFRLWIRVRDETEPEVKNLVTQSLKLVTKDNKFPEIY
jgi:hypothetical protein